MRLPKVSIVMSVYNGERYVEDAVKSILGQTFPDFEFIVINDGSTDRTPQILASFDDPRLRIINQDNRGLTVSLNRGIHLAKGAYIARMDADDISEPTRLEQQVAVLDHNPDVALVACWYKIIDEEGDIVVRLKIPEHHEQLARVLKKENPLCHGSVMMRKSAIEAVGFYNESLRYAQDYDLWLRMLHHGYRFYVVPEYLYRHRISPNSMAKIYAQRAYAAMIKGAQGRGCSYHRVEKVSEVRSLSQKEKLALYHYAIGTWKLKEGRVKAARSELVKSIRLNPINLRPWYRLALSLFPGLLRRYISRAISDFSDFAICLHLKAWK